MRAAVAYDDVARVRAVVDEAVGEAAAAGSSDGRCVDGRRARVGFSSTMPPASGWRTVTVGRPPPRVRVRCRGAFGCAGGGAAAVDRVEEAVGSAGGIGVSR